MSNEKTYSIKLDVSDLISNYRKAIDEMSKVGVSPKAIKQLTDSLNKLEDKSKALEAQGAMGFKTSKGMENYQKQTDKLIISFSSLDRQIGSINGKIGEFKAQSAAAAQKIKQAFSNLGLSDAEGAFDRVIQAENKQLQAEQEIRKEIDKRAAVVQKLKQEYSQLRSQILSQARIDIYGKTSALSGGKLDASGQFLNMDILDKKRGKNDTTYYEKLIKIINDAMRSGQEFNKIWEQIQLNIGKGTHIEKGINNFELLKKELEQIYFFIQSKTFNKNQELTNARMNLLQLGDKSGTTGMARLNMPNLAELMGSIKQAEQVNKTFAATLDTSKVSVDQLDASMAKLSAITQSTATSTEQARQRFQKMAAEQIKTARNAEQTARSFGSLKNMVLMFLSATSMFHLVRQQITKTYEEVKTLDKSFASIAMVTTETVSSMWKQYSQYADMAAKLGQRTNSVVEASALFRQQGLDTNEALKLTTDTMKLATLAGSDYKTATQEMTTA